jgi:hypothetical protein
VQIIAELFLNLQNDWANEEEIKYYRKEIIVDGKIKVIGKFT